MFNAHQYAIQEIMEAEDFAASWRIQHKQILTQDQHERPVFINANAGLAYVTVPCQGRPPRTQLVSVPPPSFWQVMQDANQRSDATFSYKEADQSVSVLSDQTLNRWLTINWTACVDHAKDIRTVTNNLFHQGWYFCTDMIAPATMYNISSILTEFYTDNADNMAVWTKYTDSRLYHRYYGIHSPNTCCNILKRFIVF